jgi:hypothetical protein
MKDKLENNFKEALENFSLPYEPGTWSQLQARLDAVPTPLYKKSWFKIAALFTFVGSILLSVLIFEKKPASPQANIPVPSINKETQREKSPVNTNDTKQLASQTNLAETRPEDKKKEPIIAVTYADPINNNPPTWFDSKAYKYPEYFEPISNETVAIQEDFIKIISKKSICLNEEMDIENPYKYQLITVVYPDGKQEQLSPKSGVHFTATTPGSIKVINKNTVEQLTVLAPDNKLYIESDPTLIYEQGIPTVKFTVSGNDQAVTWMSTIKNYEVKNEQIIVHPFKEKQVKVHASSTDKNGCAVSESKTITMKETYNLLAPTGFSPSNIDARLNRFMPFALLQRNTPFELIIIDTKNGATLFQTNDENNAWDGIDRRTGELVPVGSIWAWKVVLKYPQVGENPEYSGTITRL